MKYIRARLAEPSTFAGFGVAVAGAAALPSPYSWLVAGCGCIAVLLGEKARS